MPSCLLQSARNQTKYCGNNMLTPVISAAAAETPACACYAVNFVECSLPSSNDCRAVSTELVAARVFGMPLCRDIGQRNGGLAGFTTRSRVHWRVAFAGCGGSPERFYNPRGIGYIGMSSMFRLYLPRSKGDFFSACL